MSPNKKYHKTTQKEKNRIIGEMDSFISFSLTIFVWSYKVIRLEIPNLQEYN